MAKKKFWNGFVAGAAAGAAVTAAPLLAWKLAGRVRHGRVLRLEKSLQIGRPVEEAFRAWSELEGLPQHISLIESVERRGRRWHWVMNLGGRRVEWDAVVTQNIPNEALAWKSVSGPKHTGRIDFAPINHDTLVHVVMNYAPPAGMGRLFSSLANPLEHYIEQAFREFKAALEHKGREAARPESARREERATGTHGMSQARPDLDRQTQTSRFGGPETTVEYTRPPEEES